MANGVSTNSVTTLYHQGAVNQTGKITDMAIAGEGYFIVKEYTNKGAINNNETESGAAQGIREPDKAKKPPLPGFNMRPGQETFGWIAMVIWLITQV